MIDRAPRCRLLLVSSDLRAAEALRVHLEHHDFVVCNATDAATAAAVIGELRPDLVLIDAAVSHGWREVVRALNGEFPRARMAILAGYWSTAARQAAAEAGIGGIFLKQMEGRRLADRLRALLDEGARSASRASMA
jgi:DNA-binding response OmpR family regulator